MTIKDIARLSGYGVSTVSRALNNHPDVSEEAKEKINKIVKEHKFVPNSNARQLKQQESNSIAILVKGSFNLFFASIIEHMQITLSKSGLGVAVHYFDEEENEVRIAEQLCRELKPRGIVFLGGNIKSFQKRFSNISIPCVLSTTSAKDLAFGNLSSVSVDDTKCAKQAVDYLFDNGHKHIALVGGDFDISYTGGLRLAGYIQSIEEHGQKFDETYFAKAHFSVSSAYEATKRLLSQNNKITAIFAMSDMMAIGCIRAIHDCGLRVPDDISVMGFDGIELADYFCPRLTTLRQPYEQIAAQTAKMLLRSVQASEPAHHRLLDAELVVGESVKSLTK